MDKQLTLLKKLTIISVLSTTTTESSIISGSLFNDTRVSLYSRMLEIVKSKKDTVLLDRFIRTDDRYEFWNWVDKQLEEYMYKDMFVHPNFINKVNGVLHWYQLEPHNIDSPQYIYYNLSPDVVTYVLQRISFTPNNRYFPGKFYIYWDGKDTELVNLISQAKKREQKNEQQKKISIS